MTILQQDFDQLARDLRELSDRETMSSVRDEPWAGQAEIEAEICDLAHSIGAAQAAGSSERIKAACADAQRRLDNMLAVVRERVSDFAVEEREHRGLRSLSQDLENVLTRVQDIAASIPKSDLTPIPQQGDTPPSKPPREGNMRSFLRTVRAYLADQDPAAAQVTPMAQQTAQPPVSGVAATLRSYIADQELAATQAPAATPRSRAWNSIRAYLADQEPSRT
jgi:hypothetical protein